MNNRFLSVGLSDALANIGKGHLEPNYSEEAERLFRKVDNALPSGAKQAAEILDFLNQSSDKSDNIGIGIGLYLANLDKTASLGNKAAAILAFLGDKPPTETKEALAELNAKACNGDEVAASAMHYLGQKLDRPAADDFVKKFAAAGTLFVHDNDDEELG
jgi:hypothetical protein